MNSGWTGDFSVWPLIFYFSSFGDTFVIIVLNHCSKLGKTLLCCMTIAGKMPEIAGNEKKWWKNSPPTPRMSRDYKCTWNLARLIYFSYLLIWARGFDSHMNMKKKLYAVPLLPLISLLGEQWQSGRNLWSEWRRHHPPNQRHSFHGNHASTRNQHDQKRRSRT